MAIEEPTAPCATCGTPTRMGGTKRCDNCWEVEHRLDDYMTRGGDRARKVVLQALVTAVEFSIVELQDAIFVVCSRKSPSEKNAEFARLYGGKRPQ